jgi:(E)-4-hydroxy-3-methylbut-2-enyl-diphosphate synthase
MKAGADKIRINPGNIGSIDRIKAVVDVAKEREIPIRVGVNSGSLEKDILQKYGVVTADGLAESALRNLKYIEDMDYGNLVVSIKSSDVRMTYDAHKVLSTKTDVPIHIGITEAGDVFSSSIRSSAGLGILLHQGIGDTIRISITGDVKDEIIAAKELLSSLNLYTNYVKVISCPTCGRTNYDMLPIVKEIKEFTSTLNKDIRVAIMGCAVNGPGEAKNADIGVAGGINEAILFKKGEIVRKIPQNAIVSVLKEERLKL